VRWSPNQGENLLRRLQHALRDWALAKQAGAFQWEDVIQAWSSMAAAPQLATLYLF